MLDNLSYGPNVGHVKEQRTYSGVIAAEIRAALARAGMSQEELAVATGINKATLWRKLSDQTTGAVTLDELALIATALYLTPAELVRRAEQFAS